MKTLVLSPRYTSDSIQLRAAALEMGWHVERLTSWRPPAHLRDHDVIPYGEPLFAAVVADALDLALIEAPLSWAAEIPSEFRKRELRFTSLTQARAQAQPAFIKPADDKCFAAKVYGSGAELPAEELLDGSVAVLISEPVSWEIELRCFVSEQEVAALSIYSRNGELAGTEDGTWPASDDEIEAALEFSRGLLQDRRVQFPPAAVLDVGIIRERGWAVVESNACWGSGIYGCNPFKVLEVLSRACQKKTDLSESDRQWIVDRSHHAI